MDTFLFRNGDERIRIFEIDHPDTQRFKRERIRQLEWSIPQNVTLVPVDFEKEYIQNGGNPCKIRISAVFLCPFVAYLSLKSTNRC